MKDVLIVAHFSGDLDQQGNNRINYIAELLSGHFDVELVTSDFSHFTKTKREAKDNNQQKYAVTYISEPGYKKNVSVSRYNSHNVFSKNLNKYLTNRKKPDIIYCTVPSLAAAYIAAKYAEEKNIRFVLDIRDLWPEAFKMVFTVPVLSDIVFYPFSRKADSLYQKADAIIAVSQTYVDRAMSVNRKCKEGHSVFLGTELRKFDEYVAENKISKPVDEIWLAYIGTLGHSYDLNTAIDALVILKNKGINNIKFIVMGDGPLEQKFKDYANKKDIYCNFTGKLEYPDMVGLLSLCDMAVNPITKGAAQSIINKVGDYAAAALPVLSTQECPEYRNLLENYNAGINCINSDPEDLARKTELLYGDKELRLLMGRNNRRMAEEKFDRERTYPQIVDVVKGNGNID